MAQGGWSRQTQSSLRPEGWAAGPSADTRGRSKIGQTSLAHQLPAATPFSKGDWTHPTAQRQALGILPGAHCLRAVSSSSCQLVRMGEHLGG